MSCAIIVIVMIMTKMQKAPCSDCSKSNEPDFSVTPPNLVHSCGCDWGDCKCGKYKKPSVTDSVLGLGIACCRCGGDFNNCECSSSNERLSDSFDWHCFGCGIVVANLFWGVMFHAFGG